MLFRSTYLLNARDLCMAAVTGFVKGEDGFSIFIKAIPYNYYALFTIVAMVTLVILQVDFGPMAKNEANAQNGDLFTTGDRPYAEAKQDVIKGKGKVIDLVFPILILIISCIIGMIYTGGFFDGTGFVDAFAGSDASIGLMLGSFFALIITICFYSIRRVLSLDRKSTRLNSSHRSLSRMPSSA